MDKRSVAYFSMEIGLDPRLPTYSGGLGVLAGDSLKSSADLGLPVIGVSLLHRKGYFRQQVDAKGIQTESPVAWQPEEFLELLPQTTDVSIEGKTVKIRAWRFLIKGATGAKVPVIFLDTSLTENDPYHQTLTDTLYGGDDRYRLCQETVLGLGGVKMLAALGYGPAGLSLPQAAATLTTYHMNEGHAALLTVGLLKLVLGQRTLDAATEGDCQVVKHLGVFTTHTPVPAGHDTFSDELVAQVLGQEQRVALKRLGAYHDSKLNMSYLALRFCRYTNGVAKRHGEVSRSMFPGENIQAITNGVHAVTWTAEPMRQLFDRFIPKWREDSFFLRYACELPLPDLRAARAKAKERLLQEVAERSGVSMQGKVFTIGFARRAAEYKRGDLLFHDPSRLVELARQFGGLQIVFAGKAHPRDQGGKDIIQRVVTKSRALDDKGLINFAFLENYDMTLGHLICSGVDLWLNNPLKPLEASGTSGMKAALNGIPSLSTLDGWWVEGLIDGVTGWEIEDAADAFQSKGQGPTDVDSLTAQAAKDLYLKLETKILPLYTRSPNGWAEIMRHSIALNGSYFNTHRQMLQYAGQAYRLDI